MESEVLSGLESTSIEVLQNFLGVSYLLRGKGSNPLAPRQIQPWIDVTSLGSVSKVFKLFYESDSDGLLLKINAFGNRFKSNQPIMYSAKSYHPTQYNPLMNPSYPTHVLSLMHSFLTNQNSPLIGNIRP